MANLIIVASGRATRLHPIHQDLYPKLLINYGQHLFIEKVLESYNNIDLETITIIVSDVMSMQRIKESFINVKNSSFDFDLETINFVLYDKFDGTANTIATLLKTYLIPTENVLIAWSDIFPVDIRLDENAGNFIYLDENPVHRIKFDQEYQNMFPMVGQKGNVPGIFYFKDLNRLFDYYSTVRPIIYGDDITKIIQENLIHGDLTFQQIQTGTIVDTGDIEKYTKSLENLDIKSRYFNEITITDDSVIKRTFTDHGKDVMANELAFYEYIDSIDPLRSEIKLPMLKSSSDDHMVIERIHGNTVFEHLQTFDSYTFKVEEKARLYNLFLDEIQGLHKRKQDVPMSTTEIIKTTYKEYYGVTIERFNKIPSILPEINHVNGIQIPQIEEVFKIIHIKTEDFVARLFNDGMRLIHGDPNTSNVMISDSGLNFIDPRGRFGHTRLYGDPYYDYAKFLYGLTGYDEFNLTKDLRFEYDSRINSITVPMLARIELELDTLTDDNDIKFLVGLIWLKLPYYTINNINKAICAYAIGLKLTTKYYR